MEESSEEVVGNIVSCYQQFMGHSTRVGSLHHGQVALFADKQLTQDQWIWLIVVVTPKKVKHS